MGALGIFLVSFLVFALAIGAMAVGVAGGRPPIRGSCGGVAGRGCDLCQGGACKRRGSREDGNA